MDARIGSANGATEANHIAIGIGDRTLSLAVVLVPRAIDFDPHLSPLVSHSVGVLAVEVESTVTRRFVFRSLGQVDREITVPVSESVGAIVEPHFEAGVLEPGDRASHIGDCEYWLEPRDHPRSRDELQLAVALTIQSGKAVVAYPQFGVGAQPDPPIDGRGAANADFSHHLPS
jgi:hypothetical protein